MAIQQASQPGFVPILIGTFQLKITRMYAIHFAGFALAAHTFYTGLKT
jgi:hypothetical protein